MKVQKTEGGKWTLANLKDQKQGEETKRIKNRVIFLEDRSERLNDGLSYACVKNEFRGGDRKKKGALRA